MNAIDQTRTKPLRSIGDSKVLLQSLQQSRKKWLTSNLMRYPDDCTPGTPPPIIASLCSCDLEIGPHIFIATEFFVVQYPKPTKPPSSSRTSLETTSPIHPAHSPSAPLPARRPLTATPELIAQVNAASAKDPELKRLLGAAADGKATQSELEVLGKRIHAMATESLAKANSATAHSPPSASASDNTGGKQPSSMSATDILIQFAENRAQKWVLPLDYAVVEKIMRYPAVPDDDEEIKTILPQVSQKEEIDVLVSTVVPPNIIDQKTTGSVVQVPSLSPWQKREFDVHPITFTLRGASSSTWEAIKDRAGLLDPRWMEKVVKVLEDILQYVPPRVYLKYRLPEGQVLGSLDEVVVTSTGSSKSLTSPSKIPKRKKVPTTGLDRLGPFRPSGLKVEVVVPRFLTSIARTKPSVISTNLVTSSTTQPSRAPKASASRTKPKTHVPSQAQTAITLPTANPPNGAQSSPTRTAYYGSSLPHYATYNSGITHYATSIGGPSSSMGQISPGGVYTGFAYSPYATTSQYPPNFSPYTSYTGISLPHDATALNLGAIPGVTPQGPASTTSPTMLEPPPVTGSTFPIAPLEPTPPSSPMETD